MGNFFKNTFYNSYYYSNIVVNILSRDPELIGFISNFFTDEEALISLAEPFQKKNSFQKFIEYMIFEFFEYDMCQSDEKSFKEKEEYGLGFTPYVEAPLKNFGMEFSLREFLNGKKLIHYSQVEAYHDELRLIGLLETLYEKIAQEVFYTLFNNREALLQFNNIVACKFQTFNFSEIEDSTLSEMFTSSGTLKRAGIPVWVKQAVYFRDRGRCCLCGKDLSNLFSVDVKAHYDHIVPLSRNGLNDVSNIQLLCQECNLRKSKYSIITGTMYEFWY